MNNKIKYITTFFIFLFCSLCIYSQSTSTSVLNQINNTDILRICVYCIIIVFAFLILVFVVSKLFSLFFRNIESIKFGKFELKLNKMRYNTQINQTKEIDFSSLLSIFELITRIEMKSIVNETIAATNDIHTIEIEYDKSVKAVFEKNFSILERDLHDKLVQLACEVTSFNLIKIKNTREYFFISDLLSEYKTIWMVDAKDITRRNGFVDFLNDKSKAESYINELIESVNQCIDMGKLESTELPKNKIDDIIKESYKNYYMSLEKMFLNLASMKSKMLKKRKDKFDYIDSSVANISDKIMYEIRENVLKCVSNDKKEDNIDDK